MMTRLVAVMLALATLFSPLQAGLWDNVSSYFKKSQQNHSPSIRVLIAMDRPSIEVEVDGPFKGYDPRTGEVILLSKIGKKNKMQVMDGGLKWGEEFPGVHQILLVPSDHQTKITLDGVVYPGAIYFYDVERKLSAVNKISLEDYLASVLIPAQKGDLPEEFLAALAITARTNAYYLAENPKNPYWAVDGEQVGYHGTVNPERSPTVNQAIRDTRHMVLSKTGAYEGVVTPLLGYWKKTGQEQKKRHSGVPSKITIQEAETLAETGSNAAQILLKAFPNTSIQLTYHTPGTGK